MGNVGHFRNQLLFLMALLLGFPVGAAEQGFKNKLDSDWSLIRKSQNFELFQKWKADTRELISTYALTITPAKRKILLDAVFSEIEWQKIRSRSLQELGFSNYQILQSMKVQDAKFKNVHIVASSLKLNAVDTLQFVEKRFITEDKVFMVTYSVLSKDRLNLKKVNESLKNVEPVFAASRFPASTGVPTEVAPASGAASGSRGRIPTPPAGDVNPAELFSPPNPSEKACGSVAESDRLKKNETLTLQQTMDAVTKTGCVKNHAERIIEAYQRYLFESDEKKLQASILSGYANPIGHVGIGSVNPALRTAVPMEHITTGSSGAPVSKPPAVEEIQNETLKPAYAHALQLTFTYCYNPSGVIDKNDKNCEKKGNKLFGNIVNMRNEETLAAFERNARIGIFNYLLKSQPFLWCGNLNYRVDMICRTVNTVRPTTVAKMGAGIPLNSDDEKELNEQITIRKNYISQRGGVPALSWSNPAVASAVVSGNPVNLGPQSFSPVSGKPAGPGAGVPLAGGGTPTVNGAFPSSGSPTRVPAAEPSSQILEKLLSSNPGLASRFTALGNSYDPTLRSQSEPPPKAVPLGGPTASAAIQPPPQVVVTPIAPSSGGGNTGSPSVLPTSDLAPKAQDQSLGQQVRQLIDQGSDSNMNKQYNDLYNILSQRVPNPNYLFLRYFNTCFNDIKSAPMLNAGVAVPDNLDEAVIECMRKKISLVQSKRN